jgi:hypothetical protein
MPTKTIRPRWGSPSVDDTSAPHYLTDDDIAQLAQRYTIASPNKLDKELRRAVRAIWMYQLSPRPSPAEQRAALFELAHYAGPLSDRLRRGVLDTESRRHLRAAYAGLASDWRKQDATSQLRSWHEEISVMRHQARNQLDRDIAAVARLAENLGVAAGNVEVVPGPLGDPLQRYARRKLGEAFAAATGKRRGGRTQFVAEVLDLLAKRGISCKELPEADG